MAKNDRQGRARGSAHLVDVAELTTVDETAPLARPRLRGARLPIALSSQARIELDAEEYDDYRRFKDATTGAHDPEKITDDGQPLDDFIADLTDDAPPDGELASDLPTRDSAAGEREADGLSPDEFLESFERSCRPVEEPVAVTGSAAIAPSASRAHRRRRAPAPAEAVAGPRRGWRAWGAVIAIVVAVGIVAVLVDGSGRHASTRHPAAALSTPAGRPSPLHAVDAAMIASIRAVRRDVVAAGAALRHRRAVRAARLARQRRERLRRARAQHTTTTKTTVSQASTTPQSTTAATGSSTSVPSSTGSTGSSGTGGVSTPTWGVGGTLGIGHSG